MAVVGKRQGNYTVCNELPSSTVGLSHTERLVLGVAFLSFFLLGLGLGLGLVLGLGLGLGLGFDPSSPIVLSLTRLSFPLVRFRHNPGKDWF